MIETLGSIYFKDELVIKPQGFRERVQTEVKESSKEGDESYILELFTKS